MDLNKMTAPTIMELYITGCIDNKNEVNIGLVEGAGYEDGEKLAIQMCQGTLCDENKILFTWERDLKESYQDLNNEDMAVILECMFEIWECEPWKEFKLLVQHDEVFETYLHHLILGISDGFMERAANCRKCLAQ